MISIVIGTLDHLDDLLKPCLQSILAYTDLADVEVVVVANGCTDGTREYVESLGPPFRLLWFDQPLGFAGAYNAGVAASTGDPIVLLNNDFQLMPQPRHQWVNYLRAPLQAKVGVTGCLKLWDGSTERHFICGFCMAFPRHLWDKAGPLNEEYAPGFGEDIEFCRKVEQLGYTLLQVPDEQNTIVNGMNINRFMGYHPPESTMLDADHAAAWHQHVPRIRALLAHKFRLPDGWFTPADIAEYRRLVEDLPDGGTMIELGCAHGRSLCSVADIILRKRLTVHVVDTFEGTVSERAPGQGPAPNYADVFRAHAARFGLSPIVHQGWTTEIATLRRQTRATRNEAFDLVFIDADHTYESVKADIEAWTPLVSARGVIAGHDYGHTHVGVSQAVNERWSHVRVGDGSSVWSKRLCTYDY